MIRRMDIFLLVNDMKKNIRNLAIFSVFLLVLVIVPQADAQKQTKNNWSVTWTTLEDGVSHKEYQIDVFNNFTRQSQREFNLSVLIDQTNFDPRLVNNVKLYEQVTELKSFTVPDYTTFYNYFLNLALYRYGA